MKMTPKQKDELISAIIKLLPDWDDQETLGAYARHFFWRYYRSRRQRGKPWSLDNFFEQVPEKNRKTADEFRKTFENENADLLKELGIAPVQKKKTVTQPKETEVEVIDPEPQPKPKPKSRKAPKKRKKK